MKLRGIILCQVCVLLRVFSEAEGMGLLLRRGADLLLKLVEILSVATSPQIPERVAWHSLLALHYHGDERAQGTLGRCAIVWEVCLG